jgi:hypothetical protein
MAIETAFIRMAALKRFRVRGGQGIFCDLNKPEVIYTAMVNTSNLSKCKYVVHLSVSACISMQVPPPMYKRHHLNPALL